MHTLRRTIGIRQVALVRYYMTENTTDDIVHFPYDIAEIKIFNSEIYRFLHQDKAHSVVIRHSRYCTLFLFDLCLNLVAHYEGSWCKFLPLYTSTLQHILKKLEES